MNEQDSKAFRDWYATRRVIRSVIQPGEEFQAALEYARQQEQVAWPCKILESDFEQDTITVKMQNKDYFVSGGLFWLSMSQPAQPVQSVNEQMLKALKVAQVIIFEAGYDIDDGGEHFSEYVQITEAIAAAEAAKGGV